MKTATALFASAIVLLGSAAQAGYRELSTEIETYDPPAVYRSQLAPVPAPSARDAAPDDFEVQAARLRELKERWEKALREPVADESFYVPDASRVARFKAAAVDPAVAEKALEDGYALEDLETLALLRNAAVAAKERELRAVLEGYSQVENLDSILRRYSAFTASLMTGIGPMESPEAMAAATFPFPGVLALKGEIVTQEAKAARENLEAARRKAITSARKAFWELLYLKDARKNMELTLDLLDNLKAAASARYAAGETSFQDVLKIAIEREKMREELRTIDEERRNAEAMVREVLALPPAARVGLPTPGYPAVAVPRLEELQGLSLLDRQELKAMRAMIGKMERMLEMAETMIYPGASLNFSRYERDEISRVGAGAGMGGGKESFPTATVASMGEGLPKTPMFGTQDAYLRELRQRIEALRNDLRMEEASAALGVRTAWFRLDKAKREEALFADRVVDLSQTALETSTRGYSAGKVMFADVIESYRGWLAARLGLARSRADLGASLAELEDAVGKRIPADGKR